MSSYHFSAMPRSVLFNRTALKIPIRPNSFVKQEANARLRARADAGALRMLSFGEGAPSRVTALLPKLIVVPPDSAYPGFGDFQPLPGLDHIQAHRLSYSALSPLGSSG